MTLTYFRPLALAGLLALVMPMVPAHAMPVLTSPAPAVQEGLIAAQYSNSRGFRRCMRQKYGPRYFRGVSRAHRYHMAQACGG